MHHKCGDSLYIDMSVSNACVNLPIGVPCISMHVLYIVRMYNSRLVRVFYILNVERKS